MKFRVYISSLCYQFVTLTSVLNTHLFPYLLKNPHPHEKYQAKSKN